MADLKLIGAVAVKVRSDAKGFRESTKKQVLKELAGQEYDVVVNLDLDADGVKEKAKRIVREIKREADESIGIKVGVDPDALRKASADIKKVLGDFKVGDVKVEMDKGYLRKAGAQLNEALNAASAAGLKVDVSTQEGLERAKRDIDEFLKGENGQDVKLNTLLQGLNVAAGQLKYATRDRQVNFFVKVNEKSLIVAEGLIKSLAGLGVLTSVGQRLEDLIVNFDKFSLKSAGWATAIAGLVNTMAYVGTAAFTIGEGMVQSIGLLALLPTALAAVAAGVLVNVAAFKDFKSAIDGDAEALAALPPEARAAADALRGTWTSIQKPVQKAFWEGMGDSIQRFAANTIPVLREGLTSVADDVGRFNAGILDSFDEIARNGDMKKMFGNLEGFFQAATGASKPFFDALNTLGLRGSDYLPRFGGFLTDIATGFDEWITKADEAGKINVWIEKGVQSLKDMSSVGGSVVDMFKGITRAVNDAGGGGLPEFRKNMRDIADIMLAEPFRSRMATVFAGARKGASELNKGVKDLGGTIGESAVYVSELLTGLGKLGGGVLSGLAKTLGSLEFQAGTLEGIRDMQVALDDLGPSFEGLGGIIGNMSRVAGEIFKGVAPIINTVVGFLDESVGKLAGNLEKVAGPLTGLVNALVTAASGPLTMVVDLLNATLTLFNSLPGSIQLAVGAFGLFLAMRGPLGSFLGGLQTTWGKVTDTFTNGARSAETAGKRIGDMVYYADGTVRKFDAKPMVKQIDTIGAKAWSVTKGGLGSLMALAGGPWGIALGGAVVAITAMGDAAAKQRGKIDDLKNAFDGQTGINAAAKEVIATQLQTKKSFLWMERDSVADSAEKIGISLRDIQKAAEGVPEAIDKVAAAVKRANDNRSGLETLTDTLKLAGQMGALGPLSGMTEWLGFSDGANTARGLQEQQDALAKVRGEIERTAKLMGVPLNVASGITTAIDTLADKASTADEKLRAVEDVLNRMNTGTSKEDAIQRSNDSLRGLRDNVDGLIADAAAEGKALPDLFDEVKGSIDTTTAAGSALRTDVKRTAADMQRSALEQALAMELPADRIATLKTQWNGYRDQLGEQLTLAGLNPDDVHKVLSALDFPPGVVEVLLSDKSAEQMKIDIASLMGGAKMQVNAPLIAPITANPTAFNDAIEAAKGRGISFAAEPIKPIVDADTAPADTKLGWLGEKIAPFNKTQYSFEVIAKFTQSGQPVDLSTVDRQMANGGILNGAGVLQFANGGLFGGRAIKRYASGGIENHTAQIARPSSTLRVWAEPETGGEAYIPLAASKRARSTAILGDVAKRFGYELFANGGTHNAATAPASGNVINMNLKAEAGMSPEAFGKVAVNALDYKLRTINA